MHFAFFRIVIILLAKPNNSNIEYYAYLITVIEQHPVSASLFYVNRPNSLRSTNIYIFDFIVIFIGTLFFN